MNLQFVNSTECWLYFINNGTSGTFNNDGKVKHDFLESSVCPMSEKKHGKHPTQKPLSILRELIESVTNPDDMVLDPFMGSGTTAIAAIKNDCNYIGFEKFQKYIDLTNKRISQEC
jgi:DNA modification methylase